MRRRGFKNIIFFLAALSFGAGPTNAPAQNKSEDEPLKQTFLGVEIEVFESFYIVRKDLNIREKPTQKSKKVGRLDEGARVLIVGRANREWVAYREEGKDMGFVYEPVLYPVIESALEDEIVGQLSADGRPDCEFELNFEGKSEAEGQVFQVGDYMVDWICESGGETASFATPMFITEGAYLPGKKGQYQITIDVLELSDNLEEIFSIDFIFHQLKRNLVFKGPNRHRLVRNDEIPDMEATNVSQALEAVVRATYSHWSADMWRELMKRTE